MKRNVPTDERERLDVASLGLPPDLDKVATEAHLLWLWSGTLATAHFSSYRIWRYVHFTTNGFAAILAAATGVSALANWLGIFGVGIASLVTAVLASLSGLLSAGERSMAVVGAGNAYAQLRDEARQFVCIDLAHTEYEGARRRLSELTHNYHQINRSVEPPAFWPFYFSVRRIRRAAARAQASADALQDR